MSYRRCERALDKARAGRSRWSAWVPGRIEVLGKHTDYAGGRSLLCALERGFAVRIAPRRDAMVRVHNVAGQELFEVPLTVDATGSPGHWTDYAATVTRRLARNFHGLRHGADIAFVSDLPSAAGMSSSSALLISVFFAIARSNRLSSRADYRRAITTREQLAAYLGATENGRPFGRLRGDVGVGTLGGNQDQIAITCAEAGRLVRYGWSPVRHESTVALPAGYTFALATSGVAAPKTGTAMARYNHAAAAVQRLTAEWNARTGRHDPMLFDALTSGPDAPSGLHEIAGALADARFTASFLVSRLEQFAEESLEIIPAACDALSRGALAEFGLLVDRSQQLAEEKLANQIPETVALQRQARALGATAASAFGAGFGGSVWALVPLRMARAFLGRWQAAYADSFPQRSAAAEFFLSAAGRSAYQF